MRNNHFFRNFYRMLRFNWLLNRKADMSENTAYLKLQAFFERCPPVFEQQNTIESIFDLMIIIPVYNSEKHLKMCIDSILNQKTHFTYQAVFVNDGSTDDSRKILENTLKPPHRVISIDNSGCSAARNIALKHMTGRYTMFLDSDDYFGQETIEKLMHVADLYTADIVEGSFVTFTDDGVSQPTRHANPLQKISSEDLFGFPWGKVIKSTLLKSFCFPEGYYFEDTVMATLLQTRAQTIYTIPDIVYFYRDNPQGITHTSKSNKKAIDSFWMMKYCLEERLHRGDTITPQVYERYVASVWRNWIRTKTLPAYIQECVFILTAALFDNIIITDYPLRENRARMLIKALKKRSYEAYVFVLNRWDVL